MAKERRKQVLYPPVVAAHISRNLGDIVEPYIKDNNSVEIYLSSQPNSRPHLGTLTTISSAFALSYHLRERAGLDSKVIFEVLDNAPTMKREINGLTYFKPMCYVMKDGESLADKNLRSFKHFMDGIRKRAGVSYDIRKYSEIQGTSGYRKKLFEILDNKKKLGRILNPTDGNIKLRPICPSCFYGEKSGEFVGLVRNGKTLNLSSSCFSHGKHEQTISIDGGGFIDLNTPVRSVIRKALMMDDSANGGPLKIMVDGSDWIGMSQQLIPCLGTLGYSIEELPIRFFSPLIEDWSGSKFSKSAYVKKETYDGIPPALCDYNEFKNVLGERGLDLIWNETLKWVLDSKKFFRNYTVDYFVQEWDLNLGN